MTPYQYAESNRERFLEELKEYLRIPSISAVPERKADVRRAAEWTADQMRRIGLSEVTIYDTPGHPIVFGSWLGAAGAPTVLLYGHYDVQPADKALDPDWISEPFEPEVRDGKLYARGSCDDKGQVFVNLKALEALFNAHGGSLPFNIKFLVEGEEEISSINLDHFIQTHQDLLRADVAVVSDTAMLSLDQPSVVYGLRGLTYMEIEVHGPSRDLHSGQFGGAVHNPLQALCEIITTMHNPDGSIAVPGFYDRVRSLEQVERDALAKLNISDAEWQSAAGVPQPWGEPDFTIRERIGARPTLEINGIWGGWTGEGPKTVLPAKATAKVSCRLVPDQDPTEIEELIKKHVAAVTPPTVKSSVRVLSHGNGAITPIDTPAMKALIAAFERGFGKAPVFVREGGSIPVVATIQSMYGIPVLLAGYGLPDDGAHGPNEKFDLKCLYGGITTSIALFENLSKGL
jgi:acetylornithine deacetylase/succinyl-diaminopimelate desuccinylase-like protein